MLKICNDFEASKILLYVDRTTDSTNRSIKGNIKRREHIKNNLVLVEEELYVEGVIRVLAGKIETLSSSNLSLDSILGNNLVIVKDIKTNEYEGYNNLRNILFDRIILSDDNVKKSELNLFIVKNNNFEVIKYLKDIFIMRDNLNIKIYIYTKEDNKEYLSSIVGEDLKQF
ncbi:hypothetical protein D3C81_09580 [compost metagenome]